MKILALDPGGTTGAAIIEFGDDTEPVIEKRWQIADGLQGFISWYQDTTDFWDMIVCESFVLRPGVHGVDITPAYVIGALEALEGHLGVIYQEPKVKPLCDDDRLKAMGFHKPGQPHANDAVRHAVIYLRNKRHIPTLRKGWAGGQ